MRESAQDLPDETLRADLARTQRAWQDYIEQLVLAQFMDPPVDTPPLVGDAARYLVAHREIWRRDH